VTGRRKEATDSESQIYAGNVVLGTILVKQGRITATDAAGAKLGTFASDKAAMAAIIAAARGRAAA
jgi:hypothetical protein